MVETPREYERDRKREKGRGAVRVGVDKEKKRRRQGGDKDKTQGSNTAVQKHGSATARQCSSSKIVPAAHVRGEEAVLEPVAALGVHLLAQKER